MTNEVGKQAVGIRAADGIMNTLSTIGQGLSASASAVASLVAAGGPTLNVRMTSEKVTTVRSSPAEQAAAAAMAAAAKEENKRRRDTLRRARSDYEESKREFLACEELFAELERQDKEAKDQFNEVQLQLQHLGQEQILMENTKEILSRCINNHIEFQDHIMHIRRFFSQIHEHVATIDSTYLADFVESADKLAQLPSTSPEQEIYQRRQQKSTSTPKKLRESYVAAGEFALTYVEVSEKYIWPGAKEVNRLMLQGSGSHQNNDDGMDMTAKINVINRYARRAQSEVSKIATERREGVRNRLWDTKRPLDDLGEAIERQGDLGGDDDDDEEEEGGRDGEQTVGNGNVDAVAGGEEEEEDDEWDNV
ncbi:MAG: hypothetical protein Q9220_007533 [cf. Caloplaca sp. 1 TL-2023]